MTVRAPAKINLQLAVGAVRADGYHDLVTVFQAVGLYDDVTASVATTGVSVTIEGEGAGQVAVDETNLAARAALALARLAGVSPDVHLHLRKAIPVAAGMAGGSADAAAALVACDALWGLRLDRAELAELAAGLGADVPFALMGGTAVGVGTGTSLTPALARGRLRLGARAARRRPVDAGRLRRVRPPERHGDPARAEGLRRPDGRAAQRRGDPRSGQA